MDPHPKPTDTHIHRPICQTLWNPMPFKLDCCVTEGGAATPYPTARAEGRPLRWAPSFFGRAGRPHPTGGAGRAAPHLCPEIKDPQTDSLNL